MDLMNGLNEFIQSDPTIKSIILYLSKFLDQQQTISLVAYHFFIMLYQKKQLTLSILSDLYNKNFKNSDWKRGSAIYISLQKFIKYAYENQILTSEDNKYFINKANENLSPFEKLVSDSIGHANAEIRNVPSAKIGGRQRSQSEGDIVASDKKVNPLRRQSLGDTTTTAQPIDLQRRRSSIDSAAPNDSFIPTHTQFDLEEVIIADESEGEEPGGSV